MTLLLELDITSLAYACCRRSAVRRDLFPPPMDAVLASSVFAHASPAVSFSKENGQLGVGMANELQADADGLRAAAAASAAVASSLGSADLGGIAVAQPSGTGVAAMNAALTSVRSRQSSRITDQVGDLSVSGSKYEDADFSGSDAITTVTV